MLPTFFTFYKRGRTIFMPNINHTKYCYIDISIHSNYIKEFQSLRSLDLLWGTWCKISKRGHSEVTFYGIPPGIRGWVGGGGLQIHLVNRVFKLIKYPPTKRPRADYSAASWLFDIFQAFYNTNLFLTDF